MHPATTDDPRVVAGLVDNLLYKLAGQVRTSKDPRVQAECVDTLIVGLIRGLGLDVKVTKRPTSTTLKIALNRADSTA
jgi:hypothetical protein